MKREIDKSTIIVGKFNTPLSAIDRITSEKINKDIEELNNTINQYDLVDNYRMLHPITAEYTLFPTGYGTFSKIDHVLNHKINLTTSYN